MATKKQIITWEILRKTAIGAKVRKYKVECNWHQKEPPSPLFFFANHSRIIDPFIAGYFMKKSRILCSQLRWAHPWTKGGKQLGWNSS